MGFRLGQREQNHAQKTLAEPVRSYPHELGAHVLGIDSFMPETRC